MSQHATMLGHIILGVEGIVILWLLKRFIRRQITRVVIEFNGDRRDT